MCIISGQIIFSMYLTYPNEKNQPITLEFKFSAGIDVADYIAYALVLTSKFLSISSYGQRHLNLS